MKSLKWSAVFIVLSLVVFSGFTALGQEQTVFAYVQNTRGKIAVKPASAYKYEIANTVFKQLLRTRGDLRQQAPVLTMNDGERYVAWMDPVNVQIGIEEKAYDVCTRFGADSLNALAALLAHELTHYYEKHDWSRNFVQANESLEAARQISVREEGAKQETQADCLGGFLAFSAGYPVYNLMPSLLKELYQLYGLPEKLPGYPSLNDRVQMAENAMNQLRDLQTVFEIARHLSLLEDYEAAAYYYRFILQSYQSREIFNNAGVNLSLEALSLYNRSEMPYVLPLEPDPNSRLNNLKGLQSDRLKKRETLLEQALEHFDRAIALDPEYALGYLNKACIFTLKGDWEDAGYWLKKGRKAGKGIQEVDFLALEGVLAALQNDSTAAYSILAAAKEKGNLPAAINLDALRQIPRKVAKPISATAVERIDQILLDDFLQSPSVEKEITVGKEILCGIKQMPHSQIMVHYANGGRQYTVAQICGPGCTDPTQSGIRNGAASSTVTESYGFPPRTVVSPDGMVWIYPGLNLLFHIDHNGLVKSWGIYRQSRE